MNRLYVDRSSGTFSDELLAFGLATVVQDMLERAYATTPTVRVRLAGAFYTLDCEPAFDAEACRRAAERGPYSPIVFLGTSKNAARMPPDLPERALVSYEAERDRRSAYFDALKASPREVRQAVTKAERNDETAAILDLSPHPHWDVFRALNPGAIIGYNAAVSQWWAAQEAIPDLLTGLLTLFQQTPNDVGGAEAEWKQLAKRRQWSLDSQLSAQQVFNPGQGKGQNSPKANSLAMNNVKGFWLLEYLKAVGFYQAGLTKQIRGTKDRKTWVLCPVDLDLTEHEGTFKAFRDSMAVATTAILSDVLAVLRYTRTLLSYAVERPRGPMALITLTDGPHRVVAGFRSAFYKSLGNSTATMNLPFIGLPGWLHLQGAQDAVGVGALLEEHERVVRQLDESHGDEYAMLSTYRDWLSADDLEGFYRFAVLFSGYLIAMRERGKRVWQFSEENIRRLIMGTDRKLGPVVDDPGFRRVANAIRQSTVVAQYRKNNLRDRRYDVRYGLGQQLARKAYSADEFMAELSSFLHEYNAENAQVMETRPGPYRSSIRTDDVERIVRLVDEYGARTVCNLLIAYGYARSSREKEEGDTAQNGDEEGSELGGDREEDGVGDEEPGEAEQ